MSGRNHRIDEVGPGGILVSQESGGVGRGREDSHPVLLLAIILLIIFLAGIACILFGPGWLNLSGLSKAREAVQNMVPDLLGGVLLLLVVIFLLWKEKRDERFLEIREARTGRRVELRTDERTRIRKYGEIGIALTILLFILYSLIQFPYFSEFTAFFALFCLLPAALILDAIADVNRAVIAPELVSETPRRHSWHHDDDPLQWRIGLNPASILAIVHLWIGVLLVGGLTAILVFIIVVNPSSPGSQTLALAVSLAVLAMYLLAGAALAIFLGRRSRESGLFEFRVDEQGASFRNLMGTAWVGGLYLLNWGMIGGIPGLLTRSTKALTWEDTRFVVFEPGSLAIHLGSNPRERDMGFWPYSSHLIVICTGDNFPVVEDYIRRQVGKNTRIQESL
jgi:hypothetical protein